MLIKPWFAALIFIAVQAYGQVSIQLPNSSTIAANSIKAIYQYSIQVSPGDTIQPLLQVADSMPAAIYYFNPNGRLDSIFNSYYTTHIRYDEAGRIVLYGDTNGAYMRIAEQADKGWCLYSYRGGSLTNKSCSDSLGILRYGWSITGATHLDSSVVTYDPLLRGYTHTYFAGGEPSHRFSWQWIWHHGKPDSFYYKTENFNRRNRRFIQGTQNVSVREDGHPDLEPGRQAMFRAIDYNAFDPHPTVPRELPNPFEGVFVADYLPTHSEIWELMTFEMVNPRFYELFRYVYYR